MGERSKDDRLEKLRAEGHEIYSISRIDSIHRCLYEAYRTYKLGERGEENIYTILGSSIHDTLESIVNGEATEKDLLPAMNKDLENLGLFGLEFPKDSKGEDSIRNGWIADMTHFCNHYRSPKKNGLKTEELVIYQTPKGYYLQGYIDLQWEHGGVVDIYDYKTSSLYSKTDMKEHGRQLVLYMLSKEQEGAIVNSVNWIFTKYVEVIYQGYKTVKSKEKTEIHKNIERRKIGKEMTDAVTRDLKEAGFDDFDIDLITDKLCESNTFDCLPDQIRRNYVIRPCVIKYELTDEIKQECIEYIENTIEMWESKDDKELSKEHKPLTRIQKNGKIVPDIFYDTCLCPHRKNCPYLSDFLETMQNDEEDEDTIF